MQQLGLELLGSIVAELADAEALMRGVTLHALDMARKYAWDQELVVTITTVVSRTLGLRAAFDERDPALERLLRVIELSHMGASDSATRTAFMGAYHALAQIHDNLEVLQSEKWAHVLVQLGNEMMRIPQGVKTWMETLEGLATNIPTMDVFARSGIAAIVAGILEDNIGGGETLDVALHFLLVLCSSRVARETILRDCMTSLGTCMGKHIASDLILTACCSVITRLATSDAARKTITKFCELSYLRQANARTSLSSVKVTIATALLALVPARECAAEFLTQKGMETITDMLEAGLMNCSDDLIVVTLDVFRYLVREDRRETVAVIDVLLIVMLKRGTALPDFAEKAAKCIYLLAENEDKSKFMREQRAGNV